MPTVRSLSVVSVYVRHRATCSHASRGEFYRGCQCTKWLRYSRQGRQHRRPAGTRTWGIAEEKAADLQRQLDAGGAGVIPIIIKAEQPTISRVHRDLHQCKGERGHLSAKNQKTAAPVDRVREVHDSPVEAISVSPDCDRRDRISIRLGHDVEFDDDPAEGPAEYSRLSPHMLPREPERSALCVERRFDCRRKTRNGWNRSRLPRRNSRLSSPRFPRRSTQRKPPKPRSSSN